MQDDGNLVIYTASDVMVWATNVYSKESFLKVDNIGYIYIGHGIEARVWTSLAENWMSYLPDNTKVRNKANICYFFKNRQLYATF